ncbi:MAG: hypothetical protein DRI65_09935 [Chloroflexota bacterium]|nr:MAG: hypothetical protein DRI65_09935 [Chloroflexota bacterium]
MDNDLIPVDNWALFGEGGGLQGQIDWVPIENIVNTLEKLRELRDETIGLLQQVTGMSDIMRGELGGQYEGVGQSKLKAMFGSVRVQALQDEFAQFASKLLSIKAEIISRHYSIETIARVAGVSTFMPADRDLVPQALQLIKNPDQVRLHVVIRPESVSMVDYAQLKSERTEYLAAVSNFLGAATPLMEKEPAATPFVLQLLQWGLAGYKGSQQIEGVVDKAIQVTTEAAKKPKPDPEAQAEQMKQKAEQMKFQLDMQLQQMKLQGEMQKIQAKSQADNETRQVDLQADIAKIKAELQADLTEIAAKSKADIHTEQVTSEINAQQAMAASAAEVRKEAVSTSLDIQADKIKAKNKAKESTNGQGE